MNKVYTLPELRQELERSDAYGRKMNEDGVPESSGAWRGWEADQGFLLGNIRRLEAAFKASPWREVVASVVRSVDGQPPAGHLRAAVRIETLQCGHQMRYPASRPRATRRKCVECPRIAKAVDAAFQFRESLRAAAEHAVKAEMAIAGGDEWAFFAYLPDGQMVKVSVVGPLPERHPGDGELARAKYRNRMGTGLGAPR